MILLTIFHTQIVYEIGQKLNSSKSICIFNFLNFGCKSDLHNFEWLNKKNFQILHSLLLECCFFIKLSICKCLMFCVRFAQNWLSCHKVARLGTLWSSAERTWTMNTNIWTWWTFQYCLADLINNVNRSGRISLYFDVGVRCKYFHFCCWYWQWVICKTQSGCSSCLF